MATKDWKKKTYDDGSYMFENKKRHGELHIWTGTLKNSVAIKIDRVKIGNETTGFGTLPKTAIYEEFKTKSEAVKFAKNFMRTH